MAVASQDRARPSTMHRRAPVPPLVPFEPKLPRLFSIIPGRDIANTIRNPTHFGARMPMAADRRSARSAFRPPSANRLAAQS